MNKKGFVIAFDLTVAVLVVFIILTFSIYKISQADYNAIANIQMNKVGNDILAVLDNTDVLASLNKNSIESSIDRLLPVNYNMKIKIECPNKAIETSSELPNNIFVASGTRAIATNELNYCIARYWIWLK
ncbi:hypothetical protein HYX17_04700 [Candidatus Woesearchaeota archaeon]|nr:hypothetical protein [Candidatus Woesearchaeota archaeon]